MKTYNTYQEAKIDNPEEYVYKLEIQGAFVTSEIGSVSVRFHKFESNGYLCNPDDYCMTVKKFLSDGNKFVKGDVILRHDGKVLTSDESMIDWNIIDEDDHERYVLRAAALDKPEVVEWKNGDACVCCGVDAVFIGYSHSHKSRCAIEYLRDFCSVIDTVFIDALEKPETPEQRKERERLEAAYDLYCDVSKKANRGAYTFEQFCDESLTDYKIDYLAIVDKTNYRKGE